MNHPKIQGHISAAVTILIWGTTFISTKVLLDFFSPIEILFFRFTIGFIILCLIHPHRLRGSGLKQELMFAGAGLTGVTLYFLLENMALTYTTASNVGVIISIAPFFTAIIAHLFLKSEKLHLQFFLGFLASITGIVLITFNGSFLLDLNPLGDILAILAAILWAIYSVITRRISQLGYNTIQTTRRTFFYGIIFMLPALYIFNFQWGFYRFAQPVNLLNILFLGFGASALCFVTWNTAVKILGAVKTSVYIYMVPVVTVVTSVIVLHEEITIIAFIGIVFTLLGLFLSERTSSKKYIKDKGEIDE